MLDSSSICSKGSALQCIFIIYYPLLTTNTNYDHLLTNDTNFFHKVLFIIIAGSLSLGKALPELQTFAVALGSATAVFAVIDRVSI